jgi:transposase
MRMLAAFGTADCSQGSVREGDRPDVYVKEHSMSFIGCDVAKREIAVYLDGALSLVPNEREALRACLKRMRIGSAVVMESTGRYHLALAREAFDLGRSVYVVNPKEFSFYRRSLEFRHTNDASAAELLARFGEKEHDRLTTWQPPLPHIESARALLRHRAVLVRARATIAQSLDGVSHEASENAVQALSQAVDDADREIAELLREEPGYTRLQSIPGVGPVTAAAMTCAFAKGAFRSADSFVAFVGLDLKFADSGTKTGDRRLSKRGDPFLRCLLYTAACAGAHSEVWLPFYQRHLDRGLEKVQALIALARKIARTIWSMLAHQTDFQPKRALGVDMKP